MQPSERGTKNAMMVGGEEALRETSTGGSCGDVAEVEDVEVYILLRRTCVVVERQEAEKTSRLQERQV